MNNLKRVLAVVFAMALTVSSFGLWALNVVEAADTTVPTTYSLPLDTSTFTRAGSGQFKLGVLETKVNATSYLFRHCDYFVLDTEKKGAYHYSTSIGGFYQGEVVNGEAVFESFNSRSSGNTEYWSSVIEFTAPISGTYDLVAKFYRRYASPCVGEYYLVKNGSFAEENKLAYLELASGSYGQGKVLSSEGVYLEQGETVWFVNKVADEFGTGESWHGNHTVIQDITYTLVGTAAPELTASFNQYGLTFNWTGAVEGLTAKYTVDGVAKEVPAAATMTVTVPAKNTFDDITVTIWDGDAQVASATSSVAAAAKAVVDSDADDRLKAFAQATINLGKAAAEYFGLTGDFSSATTLGDHATDVAGSALTVEGTAVDDITYTMYNVIAGESFQLRHHFTVTSTEYTVTVGGATEFLALVEGTANDYYVDILCAAGEFGTSKDVVINGTFTAKVSIYSYINAVLSDTDTYADLVAVANALYEYDVAAAAVNAA